MFTAALRADPEAGNLQFPGGPSLRPALRKMCSDLLRADSSARTYGSPRESLLRRAGGIHSEV
jgi:hypothetical protein